VPQRDARFSDPYNMGVNAEAFLYDPLQPPEAGPGAVLPPAGHPVVFNNTLGYFPSPYGTRGGPRPGLAGVGGAPRR